MLHIKNSVAVCRIVFAGNRHPVAIFHSLRYSTVAVKFIAYLKIKYLTYGHQFLSLSKERHKSQQQKHGFYLHDLNF